jgi:hypothetical protein
MTDTTAADTLVAAARRADMWPHFPRSAYIISCICGNQRGGSERYNPSVSNEMMIKPDWGFSISVWSALLCARWWTVRQDTADATITRAAMDRCALSFCFLQARESLVLQIWAPLYQNLQIWHMATYALRRFNLLVYWKGGVDENVWMCICIDRVDRSRISYHMYECNVYAQNTSILERLILCIVCVCVPDNFASS